MKREYPELPIVGVGAIVVRGDEVLLVKRGSEPGKSKWAIPGGVVELGEKLRDTVAREVREECKIEIDVGDIIDVHEAVIYDEKGRIKYHYVLCDFFAEYKAGQLTPSSDALDAKWVQINKTQTLDITEGTQKLLKRVLERIRMARNEDH